MTSGGRCAMTSGAPLMLLWSASSWDMHTLEVSTIYRIPGNFGDRFNLAIWRFGSQSPN